MMKKYALLIAVVIGGLCWFSVSVIALFNSYENWDYKYQFGSDPVSFILAIFAAVVVYAISRNIEPDD